MQKTVRMKRELEMLTMSPPPGVSCWQVDDQVDHLQATVMGFADTPYSGGMFSLSIYIPEQYPFCPPDIQFITPIYHPNIDSAGRICLNLLKMPPSGDWRPSINLSTLLTSIQLLMSEPNPQDPLMADIAEEFQRNKHQFEEKAQEWTKLHATANAH